MVNKIEKILLKFLDNNASPAEEEQLLQWISNEQNYKKFVEYISINNISNVAVNQLNEDKILEEIESRINDQKSSSNLNPRKIVDFPIYYLIFVFILFVGSYLNITNDSEIIFSTLDPSEITLITSDGKSINLKTQDVKPNNNENFELNKNTITYKKTKSVSSNALNTLRVPYGKTFNVHLSDGTSVYLNSGTYITYPVIFNEGDDREVFVSGEAFFDVKNNNLSRFIVNSNLSSAIVFGTKFNFKDYPEDYSSEIILTEGSLGVKKLDNSKDEKIIIIKPGERAKVNYDTPNIKRSRVNTSIYTSWIDGRVVFRNENLENMIRKLERIYNVIIINNNTEIKERFFSATILSEKETISDVLSYLKKVYGLNYQIINNKIIIE